jgi:hypothetical protein
MVSFMAAGNPDFHANGAGGVRTIYSNPGAELSLCDSSTNVLRRRS